MNKILSVLTILAFASLPVFATCSITGGACSVKDFEQAPNHSITQNIAVPTEFENSSPFDIEGYNSVKQPNSDDVINNYNADCQFGTCLMRKKSPAVNP